MNRIAVFGEPDREAILDEKLAITDSAQRGLANRSQSRGHVERVAEPTSRCFVRTQ